MESNLSVIHHNAELPVSENQIIKSALSAPLVKNSIPYEIDGAVSSAIDKAIFYFGLKTPIEDRNMIKIAAIDDVKRHFGHLTVSEIGIAIENGSKGLYGKTVGIAPKDIFEWLTAYTASEERKHQLASLQKEQQPKPELTDEQKAQIAWNALLTAWAAYKKDGHYNDHGNSVFNMLRINGKISYSKEQYADFLRIATADLKKEYNPLLHVGNPIKANEFKAILNGILTEGDNNSRVKVSAKKIALNHFFAELVNMEMEITDLFAE